MDGERIMTIFFTDGSSLKFSFPKQQQDQANLGGRIKKALNENHLLMEVEGTLYSIPQSNIKYIQFSPCPEKLPDTAFRKVKLVIDEY